MSAHTRRPRRGVPVTDRRSCRKPGRSRDRGMVALGVACFAASGPVLYGGAVAALELGPLMGAAGFLLAVGLWIFGLACLEES